MFGVVPTSPSLYRGIDSTLVWPYYMPPNSARFLRGFIPQMNGGDMEDLHSSMASCGAVMNATPWLECVIVQPSHIRAVRYNRSDTE